jgi:SAM-dependent methyltransferase
MIEIRDVLDKIKSLKPERYYTRQDGVKIPRYEEFFKGMMEYRANVSSSIVRTPEELVYKVGKRVNRVRNSLKRLKKHASIKINCKALDVGAGLGIESLALNYFLNADVIAVDMIVRHSDNYNKDKIRRWLKQAYDHFGWEWPTSASLEELYTKKSVRWVRSKAEDLQLPDNSMDLVFTLSALEHFESPDKAFKEIYRVLKPGGLLYAQWSNFYGVEGCHDPGLTDIPWAHALLPSNEYYPYLFDYRKDLGGIIDFDLQRLTLPEWKQLVSTLDWEILFWENINFTEEQLIPAFVIDDRPGNVSIEDLMVDDIAAILKKPL